MSKYDGFNVLVAMSETGVHLSDSCACRDLTAAEVSDGERNIRPRSAGKRRSNAADQNSSASDSDAEAMEPREVSEAMADAFAQRAPAEEAVPSGEQHSDEDRVEPSIGVSGMDAVEAEAGQLFR